jgi:GNAT superfamily N-acetyltransferase
VSGVRVAGPPDAATVAALLHSFNEEFDTASPGPEVLAERLGRLLAGGDIVALLVGEPAAGVALLSFRPNAWDDGPVALLDELYVQPGLRNRGLGTELLRRAFAVARERGAETFEINVDEGDADARRFYERHGVVPTGPDQEEPALYYFRRL